MIGILVNITEILDYSFYPGICRAELTDRDGTIHRFTDKIPVFTSFDLTPEHTLPAPGIIRAEVLEEGGGWVKVDTGRPDHIGSDEGLSSFIIRPDQLRFFS